MCPILVDVLEVFFSNLTSIFKLNLNFNIVWGDVECRCLYKPEASDSPELELQW